MEALLAAFTPEITVDAGEALDPSPSALESRIRRSTVGGGMRIAIVGEGNEGRPCTGLTHTALRRAELARGSRRGCRDGRRPPDARHSGLNRRQEIQDEMQKLNATIRVNGGLASATASISTTAENLISAMRLAVEILREPAFPESDFDQIRNQADRTETGRATSTRGPK